MILTVDAVKLIQLFIISVNLERIDTKIKNKMRINIFNNFPHL